jgi:hypothetical protein
LHSHRKNVKFGKNLLTIIVDKKKTFSNMSRCEWIRRKKKVGTSDISSPLSSFLIHFTIFTLGQKMNAPYLYSERKKNGNCGSIVPTKFF